MRGCRNPALLKPASHQFSAQSSLGSYSCLSHSSRRALNSSSLKSSGQLVGPKRSTRMCSSETPVGRAGPLRGRQSLMTRRRTPWPLAPAHGAGPLRRDGQVGGPRRRCFTREHHRGLRAGEAPRRSRAPPGCEPRPRDAQGQNVPIAGARRSIAMRGTMPDPPPTSRAGVSPRHTNQPPMGPRTSSSSPGTTTSCR